MGYRERMAGVLAWQECDANVCNSATPVQPLKRTALGWWAPSPLLLLSGGGVKWSYQGSHHKIAFFPLYLASPQRDVLLLLVRSILAKQLPATRVGIT
jgi:hypothetical protein